MLDLSSRAEEILRALLDGPLCKNDVLRRVTKEGARNTLWKELSTLEADGYIEANKQGKKILVSLTEKGRNECARSRIAKEAGFSGIEWANQYWEKGYNVRFLSDLTGLEGHDKWLFAWNPQTRDADLAAIYGVRSVKSNQGGPRYQAQFVDREKSPNKPVRDAELFSYINEKCIDWSEDSISEVLKSFWDQNNFNAYICVLFPQETIRFGFPQELGSFGSIAFVGFDYQKQFPFIPKMSLGMGGFNLSENLKISTSYDVDLMALYTFSWLFAKDSIEPLSIDPEQLNLWYRKTWLNAFHANVGLGCKNSSEPDRICQKMGIKCVAITDNGLDFKKCPILKEDVKEVHT